MNKTEKFWDRLSKGTVEADSNLGSTSLELIERIKKYLNESDKGLDFGCGRGALTIELAKSVSHIHGIDISSVAIQGAMASAELKGQKNTKFSHMTIDDTSLEPASLDFVCAFNILLHLPNLDTTLVQIHELLEPKGLFISSTATLGEKRSAVSQLLKLAVKTKLTPSINFFEKDVLERAIQDAGFELIEVTVISDKYCEKFIVARKC